MRAAAQVARTSRCAWPAPSPHIEARPRRPQAARNSASRMARGARQSGILPIGVLHHICRQAPGQALSRFPGRRHCQWLRPLSSPEGNRPPTASRMARGARQSGILPVGVLHHICRQDPGQALSRSPGRRDCQWLRPLSSPEYNCPSTASRMTRRARQSGILPIGVLHHTHQQDPGQALSRFPGRRDCQWLRSLSSAEGNCPPLLPG
jgi:hypothetical protein